MKFLGYILTLLHMIFGVYIFYAVALTPKEDETTLWRLWEVLLILYVLPRFNKGLSLRSLEMKYSTMPAVDILGLFIPPYRRKDTHRVIVENVIYIFLLGYLTLRLMGF